MAKFLICTISEIGHVSPALPIARELVDRGHQVYWYTSGKFQALASENVLVVATIFDRSLESILPDGIPTNARIASFIPILNYCPMSM